MKKSKITTIAMFVLLFLLIVAFIVCFNIADGYKGQFDAVSQKLALTTLTDAERASYQAEADSLSATYSVFAVLSYVFSIAAIADLGLGLALSDKFKLLEEKAAEAE